MTTKAEKNNGATRPMKKGSVADPSNSDSIQSPKRRCGDKKTTRCLRSASRGFVEHVLARARHEHDHRRLSLEAKPGMSIQICRVTSASLIRYRFACGIEALTGLFARMHQRI